MSRFPNYRQYDSKQCGPTCLRIVCKFFGKTITMNELSNVCETDNEGISLLGMTEAAQKLGLKTFVGRFGVDQLENINLPCILHWKGSHYVVLYKISGGQYYLSDPARGIKKCGKDLFEREWLCDKKNGINQGIALLLMPSNDFVPDSEDIKEKRNNKSISFLLHYFSKYKNHFLLLFIGLLVASVLQLIIPFLTQSIVDLGIRNKDLGLIWLILLGELMIMVGRTANNFIRRWLLLHISMRINISMVSDFLMKLLRLPMKFFDVKNVGDILQRMRDHNRVQGFLTVHLLNIMYSMVSIIVLLVVLFLYDKLIFCCFIIFSILYSLWILSFLKNRKMIDYELFDIQSVNQNKTYDFITSIQEIKLQDCEVRRRWDWEDTQADLFDIEMRSLKMEQKQEAGNMFINESKNILITVLAATAVINGQLTLGAMLAIQSIIGQLSAPIEQIMKAIYSLQDVKLSLERIFDIHQKQDEITSQGISYWGNNIKEIVLKNITFKYSKYNPNKTLDNVSFIIPEGKVTAIVGASGSGKTTLVKLMLGYYPLISGEISIAGYPITEYDIKWWRRNCGVVMQDGVIFSESIARNIAVSDAEIDLIRLENAAKIANIHDYIMGLPLKYNTKIGREGAGLSQGQKQRILIARAVYKNPDFIFLDEATNALDAKNERTIVENLNEFYKGKTVVVVAHRLSTVKNADQIIVIDKGIIVESGNHSMLIEKKGAYYDLVKNQLELGS